MSESSELPPEEEDHVIEISLKHVILSLGGFFFGLLMKLQNTERRQDWKKEKRKTAIPSSSQTGT